jgi:5'-3' exonuclease
MHKTYQPTSVACAWDEDWRPQWRVDLVPSYKASRVQEIDEESEAVPDLLAPQIELLEQILQELGIPVLKQAEAEADDVIAGFVFAATSPVIVVSGDRDLLQLVHDERDVAVAYIGTGIAKHVLFRDEEVRGKFGVTGAQYAEFSMLRGDASDGLPGVRGIGEKTAAQLINEYGDLDAILMAAKDSSSNLKPKIRASLLEHEEYLMRVDQVVRLSDRFRVEETPEPTRFRVSQFLKELGLQSYNDKFQKLT